MSDIYLWKMHLSSSFSFLGSGVLSMRAILTPNSIAATTLGHSAACFFSCL